MNDLVKRIGGDDPLDVESFAVRHRARFDDHCA